MVGPFRKHTTALASSYLSDFGTGMSTNRFVQQCCRSPDFTYKILVRLHHATSVDFVNKDVLNQRYWCGVTN